jgi:hypothetical protein
MSISSGQRTGVKTRYVDFGIGWQHWFSPQIEIRPEVVYYHSLDANAFNGNSNAIPASAGGGAINCQYSRWKVPPLRGVGVCWYWPAKAYWPSPYPHTSDG